MPRFAIAAAALAWSLGGASAPAASSLPAPHEAPRATLGVTTIVGVVNHSSGTFDVRSSESGISVRANPGQTVSTRIDIPWCTSQSDFEGGHSIRMDGPVGKFYYLWQSNENWQDRVRFHDDPWWKPKAPAVPGVAEVNGERILVFNADRTFSLRRP